MESAGRRVLDFTLSVVTRVERHMLMLFSPRSASSLFQTDTNKSRTQNLRPQVPRFVDSFRHRLLSGCFASAVIIDLAPI